MPIRHLAVRLALFATLATLTLPRSLFAAPGDLDPAWDGDGKVATTVAGGTFPEVRAVAVQPSDGYVVAAGTVTIAGVRQFLVVRYDTAGALDPAFGVGGIVLTAIGGYSEATAVVIQPSDGAIVVAGCTGTSGCADYAVARYDSTGVLDPSFDGDGIATTSITASSTTEGASAVALDPASGAIVVAGSSLVSTKDFVAIRYTSAGVPDATFGGGDGIVTTDIPGGMGTLEDVALGVAVQSDGKVVVSGRSNTGFSIARYVVVRWEADGDLDPTFNGDGIFAGNTSGNPDGFGTVKLQSDGMIVAAAIINVVPAAEMGAGRIDPTTGLLDPTFSGDGIATTSASPLQDFGNAIELESDGKIVVVGQAGGFFPPGSSNPAVARFNTNGTVDGGFGVGGSVVTAMAGTVANSVAIQSDDKIVVGISGSFTVFRYDGGPALPTPTPTPTETPTPTVTATPTATLTPPCPPLPIAGCRTPSIPAKAYLSTLDKTDDTKDQFQWKWLKGSVTMKSDFGDPVTTTSYQLCVYDSANIVIHDATIAPGGTCSLANPRPCWKDKSNGFDFKDKDRAQSGIEQITLRQGLIASKASIQIKGKGPLLDDPAYTFAQPITVQLSNGTVCWEAVYSAPASQNTAGTTAKFKDKAD